MKARWLLVVLAVGIVPTVRAQEPWRYHWEKGQVLSYNVRHDTTVTEVVDGSRQLFKSQLLLLKRYRVADVDDQGTATLEISVAAMRSEQTRPNGETLRFDSADPSKSTPELRDQLGKFVGATLAIIQINGNGQVTAVKQGPAARHIAEPPFTLVLPAESLKEGVAWVRNYELTLEPPHGTGEKYPIQQRFHCVKVADGKAAISVATTVKSMPEAVQERVPLVPKEVTGEIVFDIAAGRVATLQLTVDRTLMGHVGAGSSYHFQSTYVEQYAAQPEGFR
jgi:hypothetical protein